MAQAPRITSGLIQKTNHSISLGLQNIFKNAPSEVQTDLQNKFEALQQSQITNLTSRMIREQKEDMRNNIAYSADVNSQNANSLAIKGNFQAAQAFVDSTKKSNNAGVASNLITKEQAKTNIDTAQISFESGKAIHEYENARAQHKGDEYLKSLADKSDTSNPNYMAVTNNLMAYVNHQDGLRRQDEQLRMSKFAVALAQNPMSSEVLAQSKDLKENLSPENYEKAHLSWITSVVKYNKQNGDMNSAISAWNNPEDFSRLKPTDIDKAYDAQVNNTMNQAKISGEKLTQDEAEVQVVASAAGAVPVFSKTLNNKLSSQNPVMIESAGRQIHDLTEMDAGQALIGLTKESKAVYTKYQSLRDSMDPVKAAQLAHETVYSQDVNMQSILDQKWTNFIRTTKSVGTSNDLFALNQVGLKASGMRNPTLYGNDILEEYKTYFKMLNGDQVNAKKMLDESVRQNYGETTINGIRETTKHPIEKVLNLPEDSTGFVQEDLANHLTKTFADAKSKYDNKEVNEYWEVLQRPSTADLINMKGKRQSELEAQGFKTESMMVQNAKGRETQNFQQGSPVQVIKHYRGGKSEKFNVVIQMNPFATLSNDPAQPIIGGWDVSVDSGSGIKNIFREAPYLGLVNYEPNVKSIKDNYTKFMLPRGK